MMLMNLFSVFDPTSYFKISLNWMIIMLLFMYMYMYMYMYESGYNFIYKKLMFLVSNMFKELASNNYMGITMLSLVSFMFLSMSNLLGLFPFIFTSTAHVVVSMGLGLIMWMSFFMMGFLKNFKNSMGHLVPEGSPLLLSPILVMIESISHLMRPFTLSIRLTANMMAGHLIVGLISSISMINMFSYISSLMLQSLMLLLEMGVAIIQGLVFSILLMLYSLEYY